ncbi:MAG: hypothetical protein WB558_20585 [Terriglobales bacterium]
MTCRTKRDQVLLRILAAVTAKLLVVDFEVGPCAAQLTSPAIATEHLIAQLFVPHGIEP